MIPHADVSKNDVDYTEEKFRFVKKIPWYDQILLNRPLKVSLALILVAVGAPLLIYNFYFFHTFDLPPPDGFSIGTCLVQRENRIACGMGTVTQEECHSQCCFDLITNFCFHRVPSRFSYIMDQTWNEETVLNPRIATVPYSFQNSLTKLRLSVDEVSETHMTLRLYDPRNISFTGNRLEKKNYTYEISSPEMSIMINSTERTIFNMARGQLIASNNIWEISFILTNESMYGLGEIPLKENVTKVLYSHDGGFSSIPLIFAKINTSYHGLLVHTSDPTEISIHGENRIVVRSITNTGFFFHIFVGPTPKDIMHDVKEIIGRNRHMDYWMLGAHICNELPDEDLSSFIADAIAQRLPYESICGHGPIVIDSDQCKHNITNNEVEEAAATVRRSNRRYIPHISPFIRYREKKQNDTESEEDVEIESRMNETRGILPTFEDIMYRDHDTLEIYKGMVEDYEVIYPDYGQASAEFVHNLWPYDILVDGIVLEHNWPIDQSNKTLDIVLDLPYHSKYLDKAFKYTPQRDIIQGNSSEIYMFKHNKYGNNFAEVVAQTFNESMIWSSSLWMNGNIAINRQNIDTSWTNLREELIQAALGGVSGHWFWTSPVCGDTDNFDIDDHANLCVKWYMASTYLPMIKIHSKSSSRHPLAFTGTHKARIIEALNRRLSLLPYYYTTLQNGPLLRPMFYQFPSSKGLENLITQFSVGNDLLIIPNLEPSQSHVHVWIPPGTWYELWSGLKLNATEGEAVTMTTTEADFLTLIRGGSILALQKNTRDTAEDTRWMSSFSLIIALDCNHNDTCNAYGNMYVTENMTLEFEANHQNLTLTAIGDDYDPICDWNTGTWAYDIREISVYGLDDEFNNYDYHRLITGMIDICNLETRDAIVFNLI